MTDKIIQLPPGMGVSTHPDGTPISERERDAMAIKERSGHILYLLRREQRAVEVGFFMRSVGIEGKIGFQKSVWMSVLRTLVHKKRILTRKQAGKLFYYLPEGESKRNKDSW